MYSVIICSWDETVCVFFFFVDNTEVSPQQSYSFSIGEEGRCRRCFCCIVRGTVATKTIWAPLNVHLTFSIPSAAAWLLFMFHVCVLFPPFKIYLKTLKENLSLLTERDDEEETLTNVKDSLNDIIALCHQSSHSLNQQQREVWGCREEMVGEQYLPHREGF